MALFRRFLTPDEAEASFEKDLPRFRDSQRANREAAAASVIGTTGFLRREMLLTMAASGQLVAVPHEARQIGQAALAQTRQIDPTIPYGA